jgi:hypothetical protein
MSEETIEVGPTVERLARGPVERFERTIADEEGRPSRPHRAVDILASLERRKAITPEMRQAGEDFRAMFRRAQLDPLAAADMSRPMVSGRGFAHAPGWKAEKARRNVHAALLAVGGIGSPAGSCLWHVVGWEMPLKDWALAQGWGGRSVQLNEASGILIGALSSLDAHMRKSS